METIKNTSEPEPKPKLISREEFNIAKSLVRGYLEQTGCSNPDLERVPNYVWNSPVELRGEKDPLVEDFYAKRRKSKKQWELLKVLEELG